MARVQFSGVVLGEQMTRFKLSCDDGFKGEYTLEVEEDGFVMNMHELTEEEYQQLKDEVNNPKKL